MNATPKILRKRDSAQTADTISVSQTCRILENALNADMRISRKADSVPNVDSSFMRMLVVEGKVNLQGKEKTVRLKHNNPGIQLHCW